MKEQLLRIGALIFPQIDQLDFTGPFEVLSRLMNSSFLAIAKNKKQVRDMHGLMLTPDATFAEAGKLDVLIVPGGSGVDMLLDDAETIRFIREQAAHAKLVLSVCTGALLCGAAGLLHGKRATTHWTAMEMLHFFGATAVDERVVIDGSLITAAGVTSGIDAALQAAAILRGENIAKEIQLQIQYAPEPPFNSGDPKSASTDILEAVKTFYRRRTATRLLKVQSAASGYLKKS